VRLITTMNVCLLGASGDSWCTGTSSSDYRSDVPDQSRVEFKPSCARSRSAGGLSWTGWWSSDWRLPPVVT